MSSRFCFSFRFVRLPLLLMFVCLVLWVNALQFLPGDECRRVVVELWVGTLSKFSPSLILPLCQRPRRLRRLCRASFKGKTPLPSISISCASFQVATVGCFRSHRSEKLATGERVQVALASPAPINLTMINTCSCCVTAPIPTCTS